MRLFLLTLAVILPGTLPLLAEDKAAEPAGFVSLEDTLDTVPRDIYADLRGSKRDEALMKAATLLQQKVEGKELSLKSEVEFVSKLRTTPTKQEERFSVKLEDQKLRHNGMMIISSVTLMLAAEEGSKVPTLKKGTKVQFTGRISVATLTRAEPPRLRLVVQDARLR